MAPSLSQDIAVRGVGIEVERPNPPTSDTVIGPTMVGHYADGDTAVDTLRGVPVKITHVRAATGRPRSSTRSMPSTASNRETRR